VAQRAQLFPSGDQVERLIKILSRKYARILLEQDLAKSLQQAVSQGFSKTYSLKKDSEELKEVHELLA